MIPFRNEYSIEKVVGSGPSIERTLLRIYTGEDFAEKEAKSTWQLIEDHKWYLSERLGRDVGSHVAAVDYVENFYLPENAVRNRNKPTAARKLWKKLNHTLERYFVNKGTTASV